mgnify:CR=1 FL=1
MIKIHKKSCLKKNIKASRGSTTPSETTLGKHDNDGENDNDHNHDNDVDCDEDDDGAEETIDGNNQVRKIKDCLLLLFYVYDIIGEKNLVFKYGFVQ